VVSARVPSHFKRSLCAARRDLPSGLLVLPQFVFFEGVFWRCVLLLASSDFDCFFFKISQSF